MKKNLFSNQKGNRLSVINSKRTEIYEPATIKKEYQNEFIMRLSPREIDPEYSMIEEISSRLFNIRLGISERMQSSPDFTITEIISAIKSLKNGKLLDPEGLISELFKSGGEAFRITLLELLNIRSNKK